MGTGIIGRDLRYARVNDRLAEINGVPAKDHIGRSIYDVVPHIAPTLEQRFHRVLRGESLVTELTGETRAAPGVLRHWNAHHFPIVSAGRVEAIGIAVEEVTERVARRLEAQAAAEALEVQNELLQTLTAAMAHDLKSPLATASLKLSALAKRLAPDQTKELEETRSILLEGSRMVNGLLRLAATQSIESADFVPVEPTAVRAWIRVQALAANDPRNTMHVERPIPMVMGDADLLSDLFQNLFENAIKHSRPGAPCRVTVSGVQEGDRVRITIADAGKGIPADQRDRLREAFSKSGDSTGLGLGLAIVDRIVAVHAGSLTIEDNQPHGVRFVIDLPAADESRIGKRIGPRPVRLRKPS